MSLRALSKCLLNSDKLGAVNTLLGTEMPFLVPNHTLSKEPFPNIQHNTASAISLSPVTVTREKSAAPAPPLPLMGEATDLIYGLLQTSPLSCNTSSDFAFL